MGQEPWGLSGPEFLSYYFAAIVAALALAAVIRTLPKLGSARPTAELSAVAFGYLAGGPERAVETAVARLLEAGALRASRGSGRLQATGARSSDPVENEVLVKTGTPSGRGVSTLVNQVSGSRAVTAIGERLVEDGLVVAPRTVASYHRWAAVPMVLVLVVGLLRWQQGVSLYRPVGWLVFWMFVAAVLIVVLLLVGRNKHRRTFRGDRLLAATGRARRSGGGSLDSMLLAGAAGVVVFGGLAAFPDAAIASVLYPPVVRHSMMGSSWLGGGGSSCSTGGGGSSCGGGGGGGGCGGGGGGGCGG